MSEVDKFLDGYGKTEPTKPAKTAPASEVDVLMQSAPAQDKGMGGFLRDGALSLAKGAVAVPEAAVGLADIATGGRVGKFLENEDGAIGFRPKQAKEFLGDLHTEKYKDQQRQFQEADGIGGKFKTAIENPSLVANTVFESLPAMGGGAVLARGMLGVGARSVTAGAGGVGPVIPGALARVAGADAAPLIAGAMGEGTMMAGSQAEAIRQETKDGLLTSGQSGLSLATGALGGIFGYGGARLANKLGIGDIDTMLAQGARGATREVIDAADNPLLAVAAKSIPRQIIEGAITEGFLEELPQSMSEQILQNIALDRPWTDGLDDAIVLGTLSGMAMGGGASGFRAVTQRPSGKGTTADPSIEPDGAPDGQPPVNPGLERMRGALEAQLAALQEQEAGAPDVPQTTPPDGAAIVAQQQARAQAARDAEIAASRAVESPDDEILQSIGATAQRPSEAMGLRSGPEAGSLENAAALSVDTGATAQLQQAAAQAQAANQKQEQPAQAQQEVDQDTGEISGMPTMSDWSDADLSTAFRNAQPKDVRLQLANELSRRRAAREEAALQAQAPAPGSQAKGVNVETLAQLNSKKLAEMSTDELQQLSSLLPADHSRQKKIQKAIQTHAPQAQPAINEGAKTDGTQTPQAQQASAQPAQPAQAGATQGGAQPAAGSAPGANTSGEGAGDGALRRTVGERGDVGAEPAAQGLINAAPAIDTGAQAAPTAGPQAQSQSEAPAVTNKSQPAWVQLGSDARSFQAANRDIESLNQAADGYQYRVARTKKGFQVERAKLSSLKSTENVAQAQAQELSREQQAQRVADAGQQWTRMSSAERQAVAARTDVKPVLRKNLHGSQWANLNIDVQRKLAAAISDANASSAHTDAPAVDVQAAMRGAVSVDHLSASDLDAVANIFGVGGSNKTKSTEKPEKPAPRQQQKLPPTDVRIGDKVVVDGDTYTVTGPLKEGKKAVGVVASRDSDANPLNGVRQVFLRGDDAIAAKLSAETAAKIEAENANAESVSVGNSSQTERKKAQTAIKTEAASAQPVSNSIENKTESTGQQAQAATERVASQPEQVTPAATGEKLKTNIFGLPDGIDFQPGTQAARAASLKVGDWIVADGNVTRVVDAQPQANGSVRLDLQDANGTSSSDFGPSDTVQRKLTNDGDNATAAPASVLDGILEGLDAIKTGMAKTGPVADAKLVPAKRKLPPKLAAKAAEVEAQRATYFAPGNIVASYAGHDRVVAYTPADAQGTWSVTVQAVERQDGQWVNAPGKKEHAHSTQPDARAMKAGPVIVAKPNQAETPAKKSQAATKIVAEKDAPADYGASNKLVSQSRADELRAKLREKAKTHMFGGLDTEMMAWGTELAVFHLEAGVRKFSDLVAAMARDLETTPAKLKPYLRSWYNGARDMMEDHGLSIEGMDNPETVRAELNKLGEQAGEQEKETQDAGSAVHGNGAAPLEPVAAKDDAGTARAGTAEPRSAEGEQGSGAASGRPDVAGDADARSGGNGAAGNDPVQAGAGTGGRGRSRVSTAKKAPRVRKGKAAAEELKAEADEEIKQASPVNVPGIDFTITDEVELGKGTEGVKFADNLAAIRTLKTIEQENRRATPEEQRTLARYVGWGGLKNAFRVAGAKREGNEGIAKGWEARVAQVEELLTPAELRAARNSTTAAHYTSQDVVNAAWKVAERFGYRGGAVFEPSVGTGNFIGLMPESLRGTSQVFAVEYDSLTARIAQLLYPNQIIVHAGLQEVPLPSGKFALAIGNPPFGKESLYFRHNPKLQGKSIHNQFFLQSLDALAENGVMGMVVSHNLLDAQDQSSRLAMAMDAELLGAIRLPDTAFKENARTEVVTDMLFFRKRAANEQRLAVIAATELRSGELDKKALAEIVGTDQFDAELSKARAIAAEMQRWVPSSRQENFAGSGETISVNPFFLNNPKLVVGTMNASGTMNQRADLNVVLDKPAQMVERLNAAIDSLPTRAPVDGVAERTSAQFGQMATAMRLAVNRVEPGAVRRTQEGALVAAVEMDDVDSNNRKALLTELVLSPDLPFNTEYTLRSDGKWQREENVLGEDGKPVKKMKKDGSGPSIYNEKKIEVYDSLAAIDGKDKWGAERVALVGDMLPLRDAFKRQMMLEVSDAPAKMIEDNRKRLNDLYTAFKKKHGNLHKANTAKVALTMPDGALVLALEDVDKDGRTSPAAILSRRVTTPPQPVERVTSAGEAVAVVLAESGGIDIDRVAQLLGTDADGAKAALSEGDSPRAFFDPETQNWEPADGYLSGLVRRKLLAAKAAGLEANVAALEKVQPEDWDATQITPNIGGGWIPARVYVDFLKHLGFSGATAHYSKATNTFSVSAKGQARAEWRTSERGLDTDEIVQRLMNSRAMKVMYPDGKGGTVFDEEATAESQMKAGEISNEFMEWAFSDDDRREELVQVFNERFNTRVMRQRDGSHLTMPGKVPDSIIKMRPWQLNAVWRGITDSSVLYDHAVGAGKTYTAIARAMERRRMGMSKKPMIVVPNHLVEQWAADVRKLYPGANILAATKNDFDKQNRRRLFARIGAGDYDMVIVGHSSFGFIDIDPSTEERYLDEELRIAYDAVKEAEEAAAADGYSGFGKPMGVAQAERLVKKLEERLAKVRDNTRDRLLTFEEMGIDDLTVDEAHEFKNLAYSSNLQNTAGMGNKTGSQKALDLNLKIRSLKERPGTSTAFLTGTPISNSVAEMYLVLRNLMPAEMAEMGFENFDAWRINYVSATDAYEPTESGSLKEVTRLGREWSNMRSLMDLYYTVSDAVTLQDMKDDFAKANPGKSFPVPKVRSQVEGGGDREMVAIKPTEQQRGILKDIVSGFNGLDGIKERKERNAERLRLMDRARKVSLDARVVDPRIQVPDGTGKIGAVVDRVRQSYEKWSDDKGAQLIFLDRSVPKSQGDDKVLKAYDKLVAEWNQAREKRDEQEAANLEEKLQAYDSNEMQELRAAQQGGWNAYTEIKRQLVAKGIPANEIRFVQEANTDLQKAEMFRQVNAGEVRVLIGSSPRMGAGTNVQERLVALHHVDVTWKPSDIEQREGRIVRQGNKLLEKYGEDFTVDVIAYATEMTVDAKMWSLNATKLKAINGVRKYDGSFNMEFEDAESASMAEMAALATGNPLMVERVVLDGTIKKLEMAQRSFNRRLNGVRGQLRQAERTIEQGPNNAKRLRAFADAMETKLQGVRERSDQRSVTVDGQRFDNEIDAMHAAVQSIEEQQKKAGNPKARYVVNIDGESVTSRDRINALLTERLGDAGFEADVSGQKVIDLGSAVRAIMELHGPASSRGREYTLTGIQVNGMPVELDVASSRWRPDESTLTMAVLDADGVAVLTRYHDFGSPVLTGASLRAALPKMLMGMEPAVFRADANHQDRNVERAKRDLDDLKEQAAKTFPQEDELKQKRERLGEVVTQLKGASDVSRLSNATADAADGADTANFEGGAKRRPGTAQDKAVMQAIADGKTTRDVLRLIASQSKDPFRRQVARLLLRAGVTPDIQFGHIGKLNGNPIHGQYRGKTDTIAMAGSAEYAAEHIFMHEAMHAATMRALAKPGLPKLQLQKLLEHVRKQKGAAGFYGTKNVDEFVAEIFTNADFQNALRQMSAPAGGTIKSAWDSFVRILRSILGLPNDSTNALSQALELGVAAMRQDMGLRQQGVRADRAANFGADDFTKLKTSALDQIHQTLSHPGKVSLWDKTVGTMRHLAERNPAFKPVFESAQRHIDDVSTLANDAADAAPRILPRVDKFSDLKFWGADGKKPLSAADNKAIGKALFEGTLLWGRDVDGTAVLVDAMEKKYANLPANDKANMMLEAGRLDAGVLRMWRGLPLAQFESLINSRFDSKVLKAGVVWSDKELKGMMGLNDQQISLYREGRAAVDRSIDVTTRTDMLRLLGEERTGMRDMVLAQESLQDAMELLTKTLVEEAKANPDMSERLMQIHNQVVDRATQARDLMDAGYMPLSRFGQYTVDVVDAAGERQYFGMFESARDSNLMKLKMQSAFPGAKVVQGTMSQQAFKLFQGVTPESLELFGNMLGLDSQGNDAKDKAFQEYLKLAKNNHSSLKRLIHRQGIAGYSEDVGRVLAGFVYSNARQGAGALNAGTMEKAVNDIPKEQGELKDVALGLRSYISDPQEEGQAVRGMLFAQYLGGSVASAFVNMTQPFAVTLPWLSQFGGMKKAGQFMAGALKDMGTRGFKYEASLAHALKLAEEDGTVSPQEIHQLMAQARGSGSLRSGDGTRAGDARAGAANAWERTKVAWGQPFALAEQFNRRSTFIASYRIAQATGMANPAEFASKAVLETQFLYSKANKMKWARGTVGGTLMTFKTYSISYLELMQRTWNAGEPGSPERAAGRRAVAWGMAMLMLMGGAGGLPFMEDAEDLIDALAQMMGYNTSSKQWRKQALEDVMGRELADFMERGLSGLPGAPVDVSGRLGMGNLLPGTGLFQSKQSHTRDMLELVGPAGDLVARAFSGASRALKGDVAGAALEVSPSAVRNAAKGADMAVSGIYKDTKGYKVLDTTITEALAKGLGFQPKSVADVQEASSFVTRSASIYTQTSSEIRAQWAKALFEKDAAQVQAVRERLARWNENNPDQHITIRMPDVLKRVREMGKDRAERLAASTPKAMRQQIREELQRVTP